MEFIGREPTFAAAVSADLIPLAVFGDGDNFYGGAGVESGDRGAGGIGLTAKGNGGCDLAAGRRCIAGKQGEGGTWYGGAGCCIGAGWLRPRGRVGVGWFGFGRVGAGWSRCRGRDVFILPTTGNNGQQD